MKNKIFLIVLSIILVVCMCFSLVACSNTNGGNNPSNTPSDNGGGNDPSNNPSENDNNNDGTNSEEEVYTQGLKFASTSNNTYTVCGYTGSSEDVIIPEEYNSKPVSSIDDKVFMNNEDLYTVYMSSSIEQIGKDTFTGCTNLHISFNGTKEEYGKIINIDVIKGEDDFTKENANIYYNVSDFIAKDGIRYAVIDGKAIITRQSVKLTNGNVPRFVKMIYGTHEVRGIQPCAFLNCTELQEVVLPSSIDSVGADVFKNCPKLTIKMESSKIPHTWPQYIDEYNPQFTFHWNPDNRPVEFGHNNIKTNGLYDYVVYENTAYLTKYKGTSKDVVIPLTIDGFAVKGTGTTFNDSDITSVKYKEGAKKVGDCEFINCVNLEKVELPSTIREIGSGAFAKCTNLKTIILPNNLYKIWEYAFAKCASLTKIIIPKSVDVICFYAFIFCDNLEIYCKDSTRQIFWEDNWDKADTPYWDKPDRVDRDYIINWYSEKKPSKVGNYWHYDTSNKPVKW